MRKLQEVGCGSSKREVGKRTKEVIQKCILPFSKFIDYTNLPQNGLIAKALKNHLGAYKDIDIESQIWELHWENLQKMVKIQSQTFKSTKSQQMGKVLLCKKTGSLLKFILNDSFSVSFSPRKAVRARETHQR